MIEKVKFLKTLWLILMILCLVLDFLALTYAYNTNYPQLSTKIEHKFVGQPGFKFEIQSDNLVKITALGNRDFWVENNQGEKVLNPHKTEGTEFFGSGSFASGTYIIKESNTFVTITSDRAFTVITTEIPTNKVWSIVLLLMFIGLTVLMYSLRNAHEIIQK